MTRIALLVCPEAKTCDKDACPHRTPHTPSPHDTCWNPPCPACIPVRSHKDPCCRTCKHKHVPAKDKPCCGCRPLKDHDGSLILSPLYEPE